MCVFGMAGRGISIAELTWAEKKLKLHLSYKKVVLNV